MDLLTAMDLLEVELEAGDEGAELEIELKW
jgi:hypothetical protein